MVVGKMAVASETWHPYLTSAAHRNFAASEGGIEGQERLLLVCEHVDQKRRILVRAGKGVGRHVVNALMFQPSGRLRPERTLSLTRDAHIKELDFHLCPDFDFVPIFVTLAVLEH
jgi:hypothetical protein